MHVTRHRYEQAGVQCKEVPRMLWERKERGKLEE